MQYIYIYIYLFMIYYINISASYTVSLIYCLVFEILHMFLIFLMYGN